jgi:hypothetical protein
MRMDAARAECEHLAIEGVVEVAARGWWRVTWVNP